MNGIDSEKVIAATQRPMARYLESMKGDLEDWMPLEHAARMLLGGTSFDERDFPADFRPIIAMMRLILEKSAAGGWNWADPEVQKVFAHVASGAVYTMYADVLVDMVIEILKATPLRTVVEVGAGSGFVTGRLCTALLAAGLADVQLVMTDMLESIHEAADYFRGRFRGLTINACQWNIQTGPPPALQAMLAAPVLVFERFCLPYAGYGAIGNLAAISDVLLLVDDLSLTGQKASFDHIYGKIGTQFLVLEEARRHLAAHFSRMHICDSAVIEKIHSPVSTFTLAVK